MNFGISMLLNLLCSVSENQLYSQRGKNPKFNLKAYGQDKFFFVGTMVTLEFSRNKKGKIEKLTTINRDGNGSVDQNK